LALSAAPVDQHLAVEGDARRFHSGNRTHRRGARKEERVLGPAERSRVALHEMGHALVAATLPGVDPVHKVSIIPRGVGALGYTMQRPTEDRLLLARQELENRIAVLMGGPGASDDLQRATQIAMVEN
jgi:cell division protease FtsH